MAARGTIISSLPPACLQAGTCRGSGPRGTPSIRRNARIWTPRDLVGLRVEHRVEYLGDRLCDEPVESGPGHVPVDPHGVLGHGFVSWFPTAVLSFWRMKNRTQDAGHAFHIKDGNPRRARIRTLFSHI